MLCLSELSGFIVCGSLYGKINGKINGKISAENHNRKPLPIETMGRGILVSDCVCTECITLKSLPITARCIVKI